MRSQYFIAFVSSPSRLSSSRLHLLLSTLLSLAFAMSPTHQRHEHRASLRTPSLPPSLPPFFLSTHASFSSLAGVNLLIQLPHKITTAVRRLGAPTTHLSFFHLCLPLSSSFPISLSLCPFFGEGVDRYRAAVSRMGCSCVVVAHGCVFVEREVWSDRKSVV